MTHLQGACHCGIIRYVLEWPDDVATIPARTCGCSFCVKHGGSWTSHRDAALDAELRDLAQVSRYRFGTETADFYVCRRCGGVPFVTSAIADRLFAVVNVNTLEGVDRSALRTTAASFDGETPDERLARRERNWIPQVRLRLRAGEPC